jgi:hypothetical protein
LAHLALVAAQRLLRLAPSEALLSRAKALPASLLQGALEPISAGKRWPKRGENGRILEF